DTITLNQDGARETRCGDARAEPANETARSRPALAADPGAGSNRPPRKRARGKGQPGSEPRLLSPGSPSASRCGSRTKKFSGRPRRLLQPRPGRVAVRSGMLRPGCSSESGAG